MQTIIRTLRRVTGGRRTERALRCAAGFCAGGLMAGAAVWELPVPLAMAFLVTFDFGAEAICAYVGAACGYVLFWGVADAVEMLAAGFLLLAGLGLFQDLLPEERWFRSATGGTLCAMVGLIFLLQGPLQPFEVTFFAVKIGIFAIFSMEFSGTRQTQARLVALVAGSTRLLLPGGSSLGAAAGGCVVCCALEGPGFLVAAAVCGLTVDLCLQPRLSATLCFTAAALVAHTMPLQSRVGRRLLFAGSCAVCVLAAGGLEPELFLMALAGSLASCVLPRMDWGETRQKDAAPAGAVLEELALALECPAARQTEQETAEQARENGGARRLQQYRARLAETRAILAGEYRALGRLLRERTEQAAGSAQYRPELVTATRGRTEEADGDRVTSFCGGEWFYVLLCDGMGTGTEAAEEAGWASGLLRRMVEAGFDAQDAMQTLNALYILRGDGGFATVDLAQVSLVTGEGFLHKWGAAPSYLRDRIGVEKIGTTSPPPGLGVGQTHGAECVRLSMQRGETLILVSDGVAEQTVLRRLRSDSTLRALAEGIVSPGSAEESDDRSAALLRLRPVSSRPKHSTRATRILSKLGWKLNI